MIRIHEVFQPEEQISNSEFRQFVIEFPSGTLHASHATETKFLYPLIFAQSIVSNVLKIMVNFIFVKS